MEPGGWKQPAKWPNVMATRQGYLEVDKIGVVKPQKAEIKNPWKLRSQGNFSGGNHVGMTPGI